MGAVTFKSTVDADKIVDAVKGMLEDYNTMMAEIKSAYSTLPLAGVLVIGEGVVHPHGGVVQIVDNILEGCILCNFERQLTPGDPEGELGGFSILRTATRWS